MRAGSTQPPRLDRAEEIPAVLADRYDVGPAIGDGGTATVFRARDRKHDRWVAIKVLRAELAASLGVERFLREIRLAAQLQHPHIVALYDSGEVNGRPYYVMPLIEGESLRQLLKREKQLAIELAVRLTREIADVLQFAHDRGIIHRDIKPENILLSGGHVLVADFGLARAISEAGAERLTASGLVVGTPSYMSPEQGTTGVIDPRSDIYSLACVLNELLIGEPPFGGPDATAIVARHWAGTPPSLRLVRPTIPEELEQVVHRALAKAPVDRFPSAAAFSQALADVPTAHTQTPTRVSAPRGWPNRRCVGESSRPRYSR